MIKFLLILKIFHQIFFFFFRVYEIEKYRLMQTNLGHSMNIRDVIHVPERDQYITVAWDCSMRLWNSWKKPKKIAAQRKKNESDVFAMLRQVS